MNREIKFRVWDKLEKFFLPTSEGIVFRPKYSHSPAGIDSFLLNSQNWKQIYEVQQFTGLKDKNGKEIYEGDIIEEFWRENYPYGYSPSDCKDCKETYIVRYEAPSFIFNKIGDSQSCVEDFKREVIGNIFENPDLLK